MPVTKVYTLDGEQMDAQCNIGKDLTLQFLKENNFISQEQFEELAKTLFITGNSLSWFSRLFFKEKDPNGRTYRVAKLTVVPTEDSE